MKSLNKNILPDPTTTNVTQLNPCFSCLVQFGEKMEFRNS